jgi:hypothetical protein
MKQEAGVGPANHAVSRGTNDSHENGPDWTDSPVG